MKMLRCRAIQVVLPLYLDEELSMSENEVIKAHLAVCPLCSGEFAKLRSINDLLQTDLMLPKQENRFWEELEKNIAAKIRECTKAKIFSSFSLFQEIYLDYVQEPVATILTLASGAVCGIIQVVITLRQIG